MVCNEMPARREANGKDRKLVRIVPDSISRISRLLKVIGERAREDQLPCPRVGGKRLRVSDANTDDTEVFDEEIDGQ